MFGEIKFGKICQLFSRQNLSYITSILCYMLLLLAVLVLYLTFYLHFDEDTSTSFYHSFIVLCYATPLLGAIIADSLLGKFKSVDPYMATYPPVNCVCKLCTF